MKGYSTLVFIREDNKGKQILLQKKDRDWRGETFWTVFGGQIKDNETAEECLVREIKEELNINLKSFELFETIETPNKDGDIVPLHLFTADFDYEIKDMSLGEGCGFAFWYFDEIKNIPMLNHEAELINKVIDSESK